MGSRSMQSQKCAYFSTVLSCRLDKQSVNTECMITFLTSSLIMITLHLDTQHKHTQLMQSEGRETTLI